MAFRWWADDGPLLVLFGSPPSPHQLTKKKIPVNTYVEDNVGISVEEFSIVFFWPWSDDEFLKYKKKIHHHQHHHHHHHHHQHHHQMKIQNNRFALFILMDLSIHIDTLSMESCIFYFKRFLVINCFKIVYFCP